MALSASHNYIRRGNVACPLSIPSPGSFTGEHTLTIDMSSHDFRGRLSSDSAIAVFYPELGDMVITGTATDINVALASLVYHAAANSTEDTEEQMPQINAGVFLKDESDILVASGALILTPSIKARYIRTSPIGWSVEPTEEQTYITWNGEGFPIPAFAKGSVTQYKQTIKTTALSGGTGFKILDADLNRNAGKWDSITKTWKVNAEYEALQNFNKNVRATGVSANTEIKLETTITDGYDAEVKHTSYIFSEYGLFAPSAQTQPDTTLRFNISPFVLTGPSFDGSLVYNALVAISSDDYEIVAKSGYWTPFDDQFRVNTVSVPTFTVGPPGEDRGTVKGGGFRFAVGERVTVAGGTPKNSLDSNRTVLEVATITSPYCFPVYDWTPYILSGGTGYTVNDILTVVGGTTANPTQVKVTSVSGGIITGLVDHYLGEYTSIANLPTGTVTLSGGTGSGATMTAPTTPAGSIASYTVYNAGLYTTRPLGTTGFNNAQIEVIAQSGAGFWGQVNPVWHEDAAGTYVVSGTKAVVADELANLEVNRLTSGTPPFDVDVTVTNTIGFNETASATVTVVNVPGAPKIVNGSRTYYWTEDAVFDFTPAIEIDDNDGQTITVTAVLSAAAGALASTGGGSWDAGTRTWTVVGSESTVNTALAALKFTPVADYDANFSIVVSANDTTATTTGTITMECSVKNADLNTMTGVPTSFEYNPDLSSNLFFTGVTITDIDTTELCDVFVSLGNPVAGDFATGGTVTTDGYRIRGTASQVTTQLRATNFLPKVSTPLSAAGINTTIAYSEDVEQLFASQVTLTGRAVFSGSTTVGLKVVSNTVDLNASFPITSTTATNVMTVKFSMPSAAGTLVFSNTPAAGTESGGLVRTYSFSGTPSAVQALINSGSSRIKFVPATEYSQNFDITVDVTMGASTLQGTITMEGTSVYDLPTVALPSVSAPVLTLGSAVSIMNSVTVSNIENASEILTAEVWVTGVEMLTTAGTKVYQTGTAFTATGLGTEASKYTFTGTAAEIQTYARRCRIMFDHSTVRFDNALPIEWPRDSTAPYTTFSPVRLSGETDSGVAHIRVTNSAGSTTTTRSFVPATVSAASFNTGSSLQLTMLFDRAPAGPGDPYRPTDDGGSFEGLKGKGSFGFNSGGRFFVSFNTPELFNEWMANHCYYGASAGADITIPVTLSITGVGTVQSTSVVITT